MLTSDWSIHVRVSRYPNCYNIDNYCLGHTEFVTSMTLSRVTSDVVISGSGDGTLRLWNYTTGAQLLCHDVTADISEEDRATAAAVNDDTVEAMETAEDDSLAKRVSPPSTPAVVKIRSIKTSASSELVVVQVENCSYLLVYKLNINSLELVSQLKLDTCLLDFDSTESEIVILRKSDRAATLDTYQHSADGKLSKVGFWALDSQEEFFEPVRNYESEGMKNLHKRWFDNVKEYFDRKEARIEKTKNKKKDDDCVPEKKPKCES